MEDSSPRITRSDCELRSLWNELKNFRGGLRKRPRVNIF